MHASLVRLVDHLVAVRWFGPNAVACKAHSGRLAAEFAHRMHVDLAAMADAVRTSTSNIAAALGGGPIQLHIDQRPITPPAPVAVDHVDVGTAALEAMIPLVAQRFDELRGQLAAFAVRLRGRPDDRPAAAGTTPPAAAARRPGRLPPDHRRAARPAARRGDDRGPRRAAVRPLAGARAGGDAVTRRRSGRGGRHPGPASHPARRC